MKYDREIKVFRGYLQTKGLKYTMPREEILAIFLSIEKHVTAQELYENVHKKFSSIGYATVYRTLKHLSACGLCREVGLDARSVRYEHLYGHSHHDHLICTKCGKIIEIVDKDIERIQERLYRKYGFIPQRHKFELYGECAGCHH